MATTILHPKKYYNVIINGNPSVNEFYTHAKFNANLSNVIVQNANEYSLIVQKFKIDSESIPLFHVELLQPQQKVLNNSGFITKYIVYLNYNGVTYSANLLYNKPYGKPAPIVKTNTDGTVIYENRDNMFAIYSYNDFIKMINNAITSICEQANADIPFFEYDPNSEKIKFYNPVSFGGTIYFSRNLHQFIGEGFSTTYYWNNPPGINEKVFSINVDEFTYNRETINSNDYIVMYQEHKAISSWACINRVLFTSNTLPITREFFPINDTKGILTESGIEAYIRMANLPIIASYLINSTNAGDFRTSIIFNTSEIDTSEIIEMPLNKEIQNMNIEVYWSDKFGNIYPLVLAEGKQIDIRLCFVKNQGM